MWASTVPNRRWVLAYARESFKTPRPSEPVTPPPPTSDDTNR